MNPKSFDRPFKGIPLLLALLLVLPLAARMIPLAGSASPRCDGPVFLEFKGDVAWPGVFAGCGPLDLSERPALKSILEDHLGRGAEAGFSALRSGTTFDVKIEAGRTLLSTGEMSPFYKATLGIPILLNVANADALTAVPGIGLKLAHRIVWERDRRGGFRRVEELMTINGIGPHLYRRIRPHLAL